MRINLLLTPTLGLAAASTLRLILPSSQGLTVTTAHQTHFLSLNILAFWTITIMTMMLTLYQFRRPTTQYPNQPNSTP